MAKFVFTANVSDGIECYTVALDGTLTWTDQNNQLGLGINVWYDGTFLYSAAYTAGLQTYWVSPAGVMSYIDVDATGGGEGREVWGDGTFIYMANGVYGLSVYAVDEDGLITFKDSDDQGGDYWGVWGDGDFIYAASETIGLISYTVDGSGNLTFKDSDGSAQTGNHAVWGDGTFIYLANGNGGLHSYSVTAGTGVLTLEDSDDQGGIYNGVTGDGNFIYVSRFSEGISSYSVDGAGTLTHIETKGGQVSDAWDVHSDGVVVYLAQESGGIYTYTVDSAGLFTEADNDGRGDVRGVFSAPWRETSFSHWEGWYSETSADAALNKTGDAIRWIGAGLHLAYIHGGTLAAVAQSQMWSYSPVADSWDTGLTSSSSASTKGAGLSDGTDIWSLQGSEGTGNQEYDVSGDSWSASTAMTAARQEPAWSDGFNDKAIVSHGATVPGATPADDCYSFVFSTEAWATEAVDTGHNHGNTTGYGDQDNLHWQIGDGVSAKDEVGCYNISGDSWSAGVSTTADRDESAGCSLHITSRGYIMGGASPTLTALSSLEFSGAAWHTHATSTSNHQACQLIPWDDKIYAVAGSSSTVIESYIHSSDSWATETAAPSNRDQSRGGAHDQHIQNRPALVDQDSQTFAIEGLTLATTYYFQLHAHDIYYAPES